MKRHPRITLWLLCMVCLLPAAACKKRPDDKKQAVPAALAISDPRVEDGILWVEAAGSAVHIQIKTNIPEWTAETVTGGGWLSVEPLRDPPVPATGLEVIQKLKVTVGENTAASSQNAVVRIGGSGIERTLKVVQAAAGSVLQFESPVYAGAAGETVDVPVTANVEYSVSMPSGCPWIENVTESGQLMSFRVAENGGTQPRSASIAVVARNVPDLRRTLVVEQQGNGPGINIDGPQEITLAWDDTELALNVTANVPYRTNFEYDTKGEEWIWSMETRAMTTKREEFTLSENRGAEPRTVAVQFFSDSEDVSPEIKREVKVTQGGYAGLGDNVFELRSPARHTIGYARQDVAVEIRTGKEPGEITRGPLPEWIAAAGEPVVTGEILVYTFSVDENLWPLGRDHTLTFAAEGVTLTVAVHQDGAPAAYQTVDYNSLAGQVAGGGFGMLCDFDLSTSLTSGQGTWPKEWTFGLRRPALNEFNRIIYHPVPGSPSYGITDYELLARSHTSGTWYTVASGSVPASLYQSEESMREGHVIGFPTVENVRHLTLRVKNSRGGSVFGASEIHFAYDYTQEITPAPSIEVLTPAPVTVPATATSASVAISATTPYSVTFGGAPSWIALDDSSAPGMLGFRLQPNPGAERQATVTLRSTAAGINIEKSFTVVQAANTNSLSFLSPASGRIDLAASDNGFTVDLSTNLNREEITVDGLAYWLGVAEKSDIANGVRVRLSADENDGGTRSHTITFYGGGLSLNLPVNQSAVAGLVPTLSLRSPASGKVPLGAYPENFTVVLATNMSPDDIEAGAFPAWLTAAAPEHGNGTVTWNFTAETNPGKARDAVLTFSVEGLPTVSVTVSQSEPGLPGKPVSPTEAVYYDHSINGHDAYETIDGNKSVYLTLPATSVWGYEFRFPFDTDLTAIIYYPRDSETSHGTFKKIEIRVVCHEGGTPVESYTVEIPPSLYASAASRRAGFLINLPFTARLASHLRIIPAEGYQENYSIAEIEFFGPE